MEIIVVWILCKYLMIAPKISYVEGVLYINFEDYICNIWGMTSSMHLWKLEIEESFLTCLCP